MGDSTSLASALTRSPKTSAQPLPSTFTHSPFSASFHSDTLPSHPLQSPLQGSCNSPAIEYTLGPQGFVGSTRVCSSDRIDVDSAHGSISSGIEVAASPRPKRPRGPALDFSAAKMLL
jgi:hypothetical protein